MDAVYTWVDGSKPEHQRLRLEYLRKNSDKDKEFDSHPSLYRDNEELRFSLRSLEQNAPWLENIYLVSDGSVPTWLKSRHDKLKIITHKDIFPNRDDLPTFNSRAIEQHLHRIPNISERFIYINDDFVFNTPVSPFDFYSEKSGERIYLCNYHSPPPIGNPWLHFKWGLRLHLGKNFPVWFKSMQYVNSLFNERYGSRDRLAVAHTPYLINRHAVETMNQEWGELIRDTSSHRFRTPRDFHFIHGYMHFLLDHNWDNSIPVVRASVTQISSRPNKIFMSIELNSSQRSLKKQLKKMDRLQPKFLCFQTLPNSNAEVSSLFKMEMEKRFPTPSSFECPP